MKESISIISELVNETKIKVNKEGIELIAMDPANVAMVIFKLLPSAFTEYMVEKPVELAVNLSNLKQVLKRAGPADMLTMQMEDNKLKIQLRSATSTRKFDLPLIEIEEKDQKIPELTFPITVELPSDSFNEAIEDADTVAESVILVAEEGMFKLVAEGDNMNSAQIEIGANDGNKIEVKENARSKYSLEYLKKMITGSKLAENVKIQFKKDYPLKLTYVTIDKVSISFILAPRVDTD